MVRVMYRCVCAIKNFTYDCLFSIPSGTEMLHTSACLVSNKKCFLLSLLPAHMPSVQRNVEVKGALQYDYKFHFHS